MLPPSRVFENFRDRLAFQEAMPQLVLLGLVVGVAAALLIVLFRLAVELPLGAVFAGFIPVIIAAVLGAAISQLVFGVQINVVSLETSGTMLGHMPFLVASGLVIALAAALFIRLYLLCLGLQQRPVLLRFALVGIVTGAVAVFVPQIMGNGYDTLDAAINGRLDVQLLLTIVVAKLLVTALATGLGMVGGLIGPTLLIGGCLGGLLGILGNTLVPTAMAPEVYVLLGMVAMMGAVLGAPLAALVAILELSHSPELIFPGMLIVVVACLGVQLGFRYKGIFAEHLRLRGFDLFAGPGKNFLSRVGVRSVMNRSLRQCEPKLSMARARQLLDSNILWLVIEEDAGFRLMATANLVRHLEKDEGEAGKERDKERDEERDKEASETVVLADVPAPAIDVQMIDSLATLLEASTRIRDSGAEALLVIESPPYAESRVVGVLTRETILSYYGM